MSFCSVIGSQRNSDMEPIKSLASFVLSGLPYVSAFHFALSLFFFFFFSYSFLAFVVVMFLKDRNITLGKIYFGSLGIVGTEKRACDALKLRWDSRQMHCCKCI